VKTGQTNRQTDTQKDENPDRNPDRHTDQQMDTWILEEAWLVRAACRTTMGSRGMARWVKMKHLRFGPTRCFKSFQWRRGWTASYWLIWKWQWIY